MAVRNPWILPAAILILTGIMVAVVFGGATPGGISPQPARTNILRVPGEYRTIQAAIDAAKAGDIVQVGKGTYAESINLNKAVALTATMSDPVNAANNSTVLDGGNGSATVLIPAGLTEMPAIRGFVIRNGADGIQAHSEFITENNYFYGSQWSVEYQAGSGGVNRHNVYFNSANDALHVSNLSRPLLVEDNRFLYAGDDAIEVDLQNGPLPATTTEMAISNNMLIGSSQDGIKFVDYPSNTQDTTRRFSISGNLIANNRRAGIGFMHSGNTNEEYSGADTAEAVQAYNNTFYGNNYGISGSDNLIAFNNIIAKTTSYGVWKTQGGPEANSVVAYTLFWENRVNSDQTTLGPGDIFGQDPLLVAAPGPGPDGAWGTVDDDFSGLLLKPNSPAINKGVTQYIAASGEAAPSLPITGFIGPAPDLGWREAANSILSTPTVSIPSSTTAIAPLVPATEVPVFTPATASVGAPTATGATPTGTPATATATSKVSTTQSPAAQQATSPTAEATSTTNITAGAPPIIRSVEPASAKAGTTIKLTVRGSGFEEGAMGSLEGSEGAPPEVTAVQFVSATKLVVTVAVPDTVSGTGTWDVRITNPDGSSATMKDALTLRP